MIRAGESTGNFLHSKEGVTQVDPLAIIAYVLGILPLIGDLRTTYPSVTQSCYADDNEAGGTLAGIQQSLEDMIV